mgnify:CR=1 FL=1|tara:strand:- start:536 stop:694 length:159 start_codon:yes stop_codon:yes gene_type:complete
MKDWEVSLGLYPGILIGLRTYKTKKQIAHVFYLPLIDLCINIPQSDERKNVS